MASVSPVSAQSAAAPISTDRHPLSLPVFRNFWIARTLSVFGDQFFTVALPWVVMQLTPSALVLGVVMMIGAIPRAALMLVGGAASDRFSSRRILSAIVVIHIVLVGILAALIWLGKLQLWQVGLLAFVFGITDAFWLPAAASLLPTIVEPGQLRAANSVTQSAQTLSQLTGPGLAGLVVRHWGAATAMAFNALTYLPMIVALYRLPKPPERSAPEQAGQTKTLDLIRQGLSTVAGDRPLLWLMLHFGIMNMCISGPVGVGLAILSKSQFGSATMFGTALTCLSVGALGGALLGGSVRKLRKRGLLIIAISILTGLELVAIGLTLKFIAIAILLAMMGVGTALINVIVASWIQARTDPAVMGRVMSVLMFLTIGMTPISLGIAAALAEGNLAGMFVVGGVVLIISSIIITISRISHTID